VHISHPDQDIFLSKKRKTDDHHIKIPEMARFIKKPYFTGTYDLKDHLSPLLRGIGGSGYVRGTKKPEPLTKLRLNF
jgi:hypothetical protein